MQAHAPVESLGPLVDRENVQGEVHAWPVSLPQEGADESAADAAPLVVRVELDPGKVDLVGPVFDVEHLVCCERPNRA